MYFICKIHLLSIKKKVEYVAYVLYAYCSDRATKEQESHALSLHFTTQAIPNMGPQRCQLI